MITKFNIKGITIENVGRGDSGPFRVSVGEQTLQFPGLGGGQTVTRNLTLNPCTGGIRMAVVDDLNQVAEFDEENNMREQESIGEIIC